MMTNRRVPSHHDWGEGAQMRRNLLLPAMALVILAAGCGPHPGPRAAVARAACRLIGSRARAANALLGL